MLSILAMADRRIRPKVRLTVSPRSWAGWGFRCPYCDKKVLVSVSETVDFGVTVEEFSTCAGYLCPHCKKEIKLKWKEGCPFASKNT